MSDDRRKGVFIVFEGGDGSGKTTQARRLTRRLWKAGAQAMMTREPGGPLNEEPPEAERGFGPAMRALFLDQSHDLSSVEQTLLMAAARSHHLRTAIAPALSRGEWVVCDRFVDSTRAYQLAEADEELDRGFIDGLHRRLRLFREPDLVFILDIEPDEGVRRSRETKDGFHRRGLGFHRRVCENYRSLASSDPLRYRIVDASAPPDRIEEEVWENLTRSGMI